MVQNFHRVLALVAFSLLVPGVLVVPSGDAVEVASHCPTGTSAIQLGVNTAEVNHWEEPDKWKNSASGSMAYVLLVRPTWVSADVHVDVYKKTTGDCDLAFSGSASIVRPAVVTQNINEEVYIVVAAPAGVSGVGYQVIKA